MSFTIKISETKEVRGIIGKTWAPCGPKESAEYGYTPEVETVKTETREVYTQVVESLSMKAVIAAVNGGA